MGAILEALPRGDRLPFDLLAAHYEDVSDFWDWWWSNKAKYDELVRPYTIANDDPILQKTVEKPVVDTHSKQELFSQFLMGPLKAGIFPVGREIPREFYRQTVAGYLVRRSVAQQQPTVVFIGGGYGAGKTTILGKLATCSAIPVGISETLGVDYCKMHIPEFELVKRVADGRASEICQEESRLISETLVNHLFSNKRSFAWDSSMSNGGETKNKIEAGKNAGYRLILIGVWTPPQVAIRRAMRRAKESRRFANPKYLVPSAHGFSRQFPSYVPYFDDIMLYYNGEDYDVGMAQPLLIATKKEINSELESHDDKLLNDFLKYGESPEIQISNY
jgi:dephospho-CoA kinase